MTQEGDNTQYQCSFCGRGNDEVQRMIAGPNGLAICDECVARCNVLIATAQSEHLA